jgi:hypothetical protein
MAGREVKAWEGIVNNTPVKYRIVQTNMGHYCGYATFEHRPLQEAGYDGIATWVPVHGGITYAVDKDDKGFTYGFDCGHAGDEHDPKTSNVDWLTTECERMALGLVIAVGFEEAFKNSKTQAGLVKIIERYHEAMAAQGIKFDLHDNFGAMIELFGGLKAEED